MSQNIMVAIVDFTRVAPNPNEDTPYIENPT